MSWFKTFLPTPCIVTTWVRSYLEVMIYVVGSFLTLIFHVSDALLFSPFFLAFNFEGRMHTLSLFTRS